MAGHRVGTAAVHIVGDGFNYSVNLRKAQMILFGDSGHVVIFRISVDMPFPGRIFHMGFTPRGVNGADLSRENCAFYRVFPQADCCGVGKEDVFHLGN